MENIQTGYAYIEENDLYLAASINVRELSPEIIRAYNYCQELNSLSVKLNALHLIMEEETLNISIGTDPVGVITAEFGELNVEIEVEKSGRTTLLLLGEQYEEVGYIILFDGFDSFDVELGCQPVKFGQQFTENLVLFMQNNLAKKAGDCVVVGTDREEILTEIIAKTEGKLDPMQMRELHECAMNELAAGLTVAEAVAEAMLQL